MVVDGTTWVFECHSHNKAMEILASHYNLWETLETKPNLESFELV